MKTSKGSKRQVSLLDKAMSVFGTIMLVMSLFPTQGLAEARDELVEVLAPAAQEAKPAKDSAAQKDADSQKDAEPAAEEPAQEQVQEPTPAAEPEPAVEDPAPVAEEPALTVEEPAAAAEPATPAEEPAPAADPEPAADTSADQAAPALEVDPADSATADAAQPADDALAIEQSADDAKPTKTKYTYEDKQVRVTATVAKANAIPDEAQLRVTPLRTSDASYDAYMAALNDTSANEEEYSADNTLLYDVAFVLDGQEIEPEKGSVKVSFEFKKDQLTKKIDAKSKGEVEVNHLPVAKNGKVSVEPLDAKVSVKKETAEFTTPSFSVFAFSYTVDFTYDGYTYSIAGEDSIALSELMSILKIDVALADVADVEFTNTDLVGVEKDGADWKLVSKKPFKTDEKLTITLTNGDKYVVDVADDGADGPKNISGALESVEVKVDGQYKNADQDLNLVKGQEYEIHIGFRETDDCQFSDDATEMLYLLPEGITFTQTDETEFSIDESPFDELAGNTYWVADGYLHVKFNTSDETHFKLLKSDDAAYMSFDIRGTFNSNGKEVDWGNDIKTDVTLTEKHDASVEKTGWYNAQDKKIHYIVTVKSDGTSSDVKIVDAINGTALTSDVKGLNDLTIKKNNQEVTDTAGFNLSIDDNVFTLEMPDMKDKDVYTVEYTASVDFDALGKSGKTTVDSAGNTVKLTTKDEPEGEEAQAYEFDVNYSTISKSATEVSEAKTTDEGGTEVKYREVEWKIVANKEKLTTIDHITDTVRADSRDLMVMSGEGITVIVKRDGQPNEERTLKWGESGTNGSLTKSDDGYSWTYRPPETDKKAEYEITYKTKVNITDLKKGTTVNNDVEDGVGETGAGAGVGPDGVVSLVKSADSVTAKEVEWVIDITVPKNGTSSTRVVDTLPTHGGGNPVFTGNYYDDYKSYSVTGLIDGEERATVTYGYQHWNTDWEKGEIHETSVKSPQDDKDCLVEVYINFEHLENGSWVKGLKKTEAERNLRVTVTTTNNSDWLDAASEQYWNYKDHTNTAKFGDIDASSTVEVGRQKITKEYPENQSGDVKLKDGKTYKTYKYRLTLLGVTDQVNQITDTFDTSVFEVLDIDSIDSESIKNNNPFKDNGQIELMSNASSSAGFNSTPATLTPNANGVTIGTTQLDKQPSGAYYSNYRITYYLVMKDEAKAAEKALAAGGKATFTNTATWGEAESKAEVEYGNPIVDKKASAVHEKNGRNQVDYTVTINPDKLKLNDSKDMTLEDTFSGNMSIDYSSIQITTDPSTNAVTYDYYGTTGKYTVPDETKVVIKYSCYVISTGTLRLSNKATLTGGYSSETSQWADMSTEGRGGAHVIAIYLQKYQEGNQAVNLAGAKFKLLDSELNPITYTNKMATSSANYSKIGQPIIFETTSSGNLLITLNRHDDGVNLKQGTVYYLEEIEAPAGMALDSTLYSFVISTDLTHAEYTREDGVYVYYAGDILKVRNSPDKEQMVVTKRFGGNVKLTDAQKKKISFKVEEVDAYGNVVENGFCKEFSYADMESGRYTLDNDTASDNGVTKKFGAGYYKVTELHADTNSMRDFENDADKLGDRVAATTYYTVKRGGTADVPTTPETTSDSVSTGPAQVESGKTTNVTFTNTYNTGAYYLTKIDGSTDQPIAGAKFGVFAASDEGQTSAVTTYETKSDGLITIMRAGDKESTLSEGVLYYVVETEAAQGYQLPDNPHKYYFYFGESVPDGATEHNAIRLADGSAYQNVYNASDTSVMVQKRWQNADGSTMSDADVASKTATVTIKRKKSEVKACTITVNLTDSDGSVYSQAFKVPQGKEAKIKFAGNVNLTINGTAHELSWQGLEYTIGAKETEVASITVTVAVSGNRYVWNENDFKKNVTLGSLYDKWEYSDPADDDSFTTVEYVDEDGKKSTTSTTKELNYSNDFTFTWDHLEKTDSDGNKYTYYISESPISDFATTYENNDGIESGTIVVTNKSTKVQLGTLEITKSFDDGDKLTEAQKKAVTFTVIGPNNFRQTATYKDAANFNNTSTWTLSGIAAGTYTVTESNANVDGYTRTTTYQVNGAATATTGDETTATVSADNTTKVAFTNTYTQITGSLKLKKVVTVGNKSTIGTRADGTYTFTVAGPGTSGTVSKTVVITVENGVAKSATVDDASVDLDGSGFVEVAGLLPGEYTVTETGSTNNRVTLDTVAKQVTVVAGKTGDEVPTGATATITNNFEMTSVKASKQWKDATGNEITAPSGANVTFGVFVSSTDTNPLATVTLNGTADSVPADGETPAGYESSAWEATFKNLPKLDANGNEVHYVIKETSGYSTFTNQDPNGVINNGSITNKQDTGSLKITKKVTVNDQTTSGHLADGTYKFTVKDSNGTPAKKANGDDVGDVPITISSGAASTFEVTGLAPGTYTITEKESSNKQVPINTTSQTVTVEAGKAGNAVPTGATATITNNFEMTSVKASKRWQDATGAVMTTPPAGAEVLFDVFLADSEGKATGKRLAEAKLNGTAATTIPADGETPAGYASGAWEATFKNLPKYDATTGAEASYVIKEVSGYAGFTSQNTDGVTNNRTIANKQDTGSLKIMKSVTVNSATTTDTRADGKYTFTVTGPNSYSKVITLEIKNGQSSETTLSGLEPGDYTITEGETNNGTALVGDNGKKVTVSPDSATTTVPTVEFVNNIDFGSLEVTKTTVSNTASDKSKKFHFKVTLSDTSINGTYGTDDAVMKFENGVAEFDLSNGQRKKAEGLPSGITYSVAETLSEHYVTTWTGKTDDATAATGTIPAHGNALAAFTNTRDEGGLSVTKHVDSANADHKAETKKFSFKVKLSDETISGKYDEMTFTNGVAEFQLSDHQSILASGLPEDVEYIVTETADDDFITTWTGSTSGTISKSTPASVIATNTAKGSLKITKNVTVNGAATTGTLADGTYKFTVKGADGQPAKKADADGTEVGEVSITITNGASNTAEVTGLAPGTYTVHEETSDNGTALSSGNDVSVTVSAGKTGADVVAAGTAAFTNNIDTGSLKIEKTVAGTTDTNKDFSFEVTLTAPEGVTLASSYPAKKNGASAGNVTVGADGKITGITLKANETFEILDLPPSTQYAVTEVNLPEGYTQSTHANDTGSIPARSAATATIRNNYATTTVTGAIEAIKTLSGARLQSDQFEFELIADSQNPSDGIAGSFIQKPKNDAAGKVNFGSVTFTKEGVWKYTIKETNTNADRMTYDKSEYLVTFDVDDNGFGALIVNKTIKKVKDSSGADVEATDQVDADIAFANSYTPDTPSFEKKIKDKNDTTGVESDWQDTADYDIGDVVPFRLKATLPSDVSSYTHYHLTFEDQMEPGLTFKGIQKVTVNNVPTTAYTVTPAEGGQSFTLKLAWGVGETVSSTAGLDNNEVVVEFGAELNSGATLGKHGNVNGAKLTYSNNPSVTTKAEDEKPGNEDQKPWDYVIVFTYKVDINKINNHEMPLKGAAFKLEKKQQNGTYTLVKQVPAGETTTFSFVGLDDGEYKLTETTVPNGCEPIDPITFTVAAVHEENTPNEWNYESKATDPAQFNGAKRDALLTSLTGSETTGVLDLTSDADNAALEGSVKNEELSTPDFNKKIADTNDTERVQPDIDKIEEAEWKDSADYDIGDKVPYRLTATLPDDVTGYKHYHITFTDQMESTLKYSKDASVVITAKGANGSTIEYKGEITKTENDHDFALTLRWGVGEKDAITESLNGATVQVFFTAELTDGANIGSKGNVNGAKLTYSNNPNVTTRSEDETPSNEGNKPWDYVIAFTYQVDISKVYKDSEGAEHPLAGAKFKLEKQVKDGDNTKSELVKEFTAGTETTFSFVGLDDGTYVLTETVAPKGYEKIKPIYFTVSATHTGTWENDNSEAKLGFLPDKVNPARADILTDLAADDTTPNVTTGKLTFTRDVTNDIISTSVTNTWDKPLGSLKVTKKLEGLRSGDEESEAAKNQTFKVVVYNSNDQFVYKDSAGVTQFASTDGYIDPVFGDPYGTAYEKFGMDVSVGEPLELTNVPEALYVVYEADANGNLEVGSRKYVWAGKDDADVAEVKVNDPAQLVVTNHYTEQETGALRLIKTVDAKVGSAYLTQMAESVRFRVVRDADGKEVASVSLKDILPTQMDSTDSSTRAYWTLTNLEVGSYTVYEYQDKVVYGKNSREIVNIIKDEDGEYKDAIHVEVTKMDADADVAANATTLRLSNIYSESIAEFTPSVTKDIIGSDYTGNESFTFTIAKADCEDASAFDREVNGPGDASFADGEEVAVKAGDTTAFSKILYTTPGSYYYQITETKGTTPGMTYAYADQPIYLRVDVNSEGSVFYRYDEDLETLLTATHEKDDNDFQEYVAATDTTPATVADFTALNVYNAGSIKVLKDFAGTVASAADLSDAEQAAISFTVTSNGDEVASTTLYQMVQDAAEGDEPSWTIIGLAPGDYVVTETIDEGAEREGITITASYSVEGGAVALAEDESAEVVVTNTYTQDTPTPTPETGTLVVTKALSGLALKDLTKKEQKAITFSVTNADGEAVKDADGNELKTTLYQMVQNADGDTPTWTIADLEPGTYVVTETGAKRSGYTVTATYKVDKGKAATKAPQVEVQAGETHTVAVTNTYTKPTMPKKTTTKRSTPKTTTTGTTSKTSTPKTGDTTNLATAQALMFAGGLMLVAASLRRRRLQ